LKKTRVFQLARELRISSDALMSIIVTLELDAEVTSHMASVGEEVVTKIKEHFAKEKAAVQEAQRRKVRFRDGLAAKEAPPESGAKRPVPSKTRSAPPPAPARPAPVRPAPARPAPPLKGMPHQRPKTPPPPGPGAPRPKLPPTPVTSRPRRAPIGPAPGMDLPSRMVPQGAQDRSGPSRGFSPAPAGVQTGRPRQRKKKKKGAVDQKLVRESVKKTLATMDSGRRRGRKRRREDGQPMPEEDVQRIQIEEFATVSELAGGMDVTPAEVIAACLQLGIIANINRRLDRDSIETIADEFGFEVEFIDELAREESHEDVVVDAPWEPRPPIVTVMGHVDHGKTSLLDSIRKTNVTAQESGAITQHIGAHEVRFKQGRIVFLDTPGHEAFTAMRARGVQVTDLVILVVAADDRVNEQTVEAINHARAAGVPIVVAINKCDLPNANVDRIKKELSENSLLVEDWGGKTVAVEVSAKTGHNVDKMLEMILLVSEMLELKAQPERAAKGVVIEAKREQGRGVVGTVLVQTGTLRVGAAFVCGSHWGRVRAMQNDYGERVLVAAPATPVEVLGWSGLPMAGDIFTMTESDEEARTIASRRGLIAREYALRQRRPTLATLQEKIRQGEVAELRVILKADVTGSVEVIRDTLEQQSTDKVAMRIVHSGVGNITESDVNLAVASEAIIIGFHVRTEPKAKATADEQKIDIRIYEVIHEVISDMRDAMAGKLKPKEVEKILGEAEVRHVFYISRYGNVAGSYVTSGIVQRTARARVFRDSEQIFDGKVKALKRFKDDVREVSSGFECGITIEGFDEFQEKDVIRVYEVEEVAAEL
jgi:translation initiation factor IF-2